jgi:hypothetical protein
MKFSRGQYWVPQRRTWNLRFNAVLLEEYFVYPLGWGWLGRARKKDGYLVYMLFYSYLSVTLSWSVIGPQGTSIVRRSPRVSRIPYKSGRLFSHFFKQNFAPAGCCTYMILRGDYGEASRMLPSPKKERLHLPGVVRSWFYVVTTERLRVCYRPPKKKDCTCRVLYVHDSTWWLRRGFAYATVVKI